MFKATAKRVRARKMKAENNQTVAGQGDGSVACRQLAVLDRPLDWRLDPV